MSAEKFVRLCATWQRVFLRNGIRKHLQACIADKVAFEHQGSKEWERSFGSRTRKDRNARASNLIRGEAKILKAPESTHSCGGRKPCNAR